MCRKLRWIWSRKMKTHEGTEIGAKILKYFRLKLSIVPVISPGNGTAKNPGGIFGPDPRGFIVYRQHISLSQIKPNGSVFRKKKIKFLKE